MKCAPRWPRRSLCIHCFNSVPQTSTTVTIGAESNLPAPRFVSLRAEGANDRRGPGLEHRVDWICERAGLPLRVTGESGPCRRVRDPDGVEVWMHAQNLDQRGRVFVNQPDALHSSASSTGAGAADLDAAVIGAVTGCAGDWRRAQRGGPGGQCGALGRRMRRAGAQDRDDAGLRPGPAVPFLAPTAPGL